MHIIYISSFLVVSEIYKTDKMEEDKAYLSLK